MDFGLSEEQKAWQKACHDFVSKEVLPNAQHVDETGEFNWDAVRKGAALGLLGLNIPEAYGGAQVDAVSAAIAIEELGWGCGSTALSLAAHNGLGTTPIVNYGSEGLKRKWLPVVCSGKGRLGSLALTEPISREESPRGPKRPRSDGVSMERRCGARMHPSPSTSSRWPVPIPRAVLIP
jgi:butyryl-CoA dehydrogenase